MKFLGTMLWSPSVVLVFPPGRMLVDTRCRLNSVELLLGTVPEVVRLEGVDENGKDTVHYGRRQYRNEA